MKRILFFLTILCLSIFSYSQNYLGKTEYEIKNLLLKGNEVVDFNVDQTSKARILTATTEMYVNMYFINNNTHKVFSIFTIPRNTYAENAFIKLLNNNTISIEGTKDKSWVTKDHNCLISFSWIKLLNKSGFVFSPIDAATKAELFN